VHKVLTRTTYVRRHRFNTKFWKTRERKPEAGLVEMAVPPIIEATEFEALQTLPKNALLRSNSASRCQQTHASYRHQLSR
jgi:hypothetical protein